MASPKFDDDDDEADEMEFEALPPKPKFDRFFLVILIGSLLLSLAAYQINSNTLQTNNLVDGHRYFTEISQGTTAGRPVLNLLLSLTFLGEPGFELVCGFLIYALIGLIIYSISKDKIITLMILLGFSMSLMVSTNLYAQAIVVIACLYFWVYEDARFGLLQITKYLVLAVFAFFAHTWGAPLVIGMFAAKYLNDKKIVSRVDKRLLLVGYLALVATIWFFIMPSAEQVAFFYPAFAGMNLGKLNTFLWFFAVFTPLFAAFYVNLDNSDKKNILITLLIMAGTIAVYVTDGYHEIDFWRGLIVLELIVAVLLCEKRQEVKEHQIANNDWLTWTPVVLILFGLERIIIGLII